MDARDGARAARGGLVALLTGLLVAFAALLAYQPVLANFFHPIDDPLVIWCADRGEDPTPHFRPLYLVWNALLLAIFGTVPFGWYATGLLVHVASALAIAHLAWRVAASRIQAAAAGLAFAVFYSPHEAVLWVSANCGLLAVLAVLLAGTAWFVVVDPAAGPPGRRRLTYALALLALMLAMGFKEDCVLAGPLFLGLHLARNGWRSVLRRRSLLLYAVPAALAVLYLRLALQPSLWADRLGVGQYRFAPALLPELLQSLAWLFWPRRVDAASWTMASAGVGLAVLAGVALAGIRVRRRFPLVLLGLGLTICGLLPVLPGPFAIPGSRYAYPASIGAALLLAGLFGILWSWRPGAVWRTALVLAGLAWSTGNGLSIRAVEGWRFDRACARLERMVESSRPAMSLPEATVVGPALFNAHDYMLSLALWCGVADRDLSIEWASAGEELLARLAPGGDLDPRVHAVFGVQPDGEVVRLGSAGGALAEQWAAMARDHDERGLGRTVAVLRRRRP
ncbi:MAG: hypothetical protein AB1726_16095 [Planctomycetota bacterium]